MARHSSKILKSKYLKSLFLFFLCYFILLFIIIIIVMIKKVLFCFALIFCDFIKAARRKKNDS